MNQAGITRTRAIRSVIKRVVVQGNLELTSPAHFGNGDADEIIDMPLQVDALDGKSPLLAGASIAGALRAYLSRFPDKPSDLFGGARMTADGFQSPLIVDEAIGQIPKGLIPERRHGNAIDPSSGTVGKDLLYDYLLWPVGTSFPVAFELLISEGCDEPKLMGQLSTVLSGLECGDIHLGKRKQRGFGSVQITKWKVWEFDHRNASSQSDWIRYCCDASAVKPEIGASIGELLKVKALPRDSGFFRIKARLKPIGSLIVRDGGGKDDKGSDAAHLKRQGTRGSEPVLPGTSLGGVLRSRARRIEQTLRCGKGDPITQSLFGTMQGRSLVRVSESVIQNTTMDLIQDRVRIDRWTGGAADSAKFDSQPVFAKDSSCVEVLLEVERPTDDQKGLLLLVFKDLATGDLPVGGESSIGRGRMKLIDATITDNGRDISVTPVGAGLKAEWADKSDPNVPLPLDGYVQTLNTSIQSQPNQPAA